MARDYQTKSNVGALPDTITATRFGAGEFNSIAVELENAVTTSDQTLAPADGTGEVTDQLAMSLAIYGAGGAFYHADTGAVNAYVLTPISPKESPPAYFDGFTVIFEAGTVNTTASTVNVNSLGVKDITYSAGNALVGGELSGSCGIKYNLSDDRFELLFSSGALAGLSQVYVIDASQADQGAASTNANTYTVFDAAAAIGTSKNATLYFPHNPVAGNQTLFTFDTSLDLTSYPNLSFKIDQGAQFDRTTGDEIFTIYSPANLKIGRRQKITDVGMISFYAPGDVYPSWWGTFPNGSDDTTILNLALSAALNTGATGFLDTSTVQILPGIYYLEATSISAIEVNFNAPHAHFIVTAKPTTQYDVFLTIDGNNAVNILTINIGMISGYIDDIFVDTSHYGYGIYIEKLYQAKLNIGSIRGFYIGLFLNGESDNHIAENLIEIGSIIGCDYGVLMRSGTIADTQCEANRIYVNYMSYCLNGVDLAALDYDLTSNIIEVQVLEMHNRASSTGFRLSGENCFSNTLKATGFIVPPTGSGPIIGCYNDATYGAPIDNIFEMCYMDYSQIVTETGAYNIFRFDGKNNSRPSGTPNGFARSTVMLDAAPTISNWREGDKAWNNSPSDNTIGWINTADGTPGTWQKFGQIVLDGSDTWDPPSVAAGSYTQKDVTVTGAALGDFAIAAFSISTALLQLDAQVVSANTVSVQLFNPTAGAIDLASGTIYARVYKR